MQLSLSVSWKSMLKQANRGRFPAPSSPNPPLTHSIELQIGLMHPFYKYLSKHSAATELTIHEDPGTKNNYTSSYSLPRLSKGTP